MKRTKASLLVVAVIGLVLLAGTAVALYVFNNNQIRNTTTSDTTSQSSQNQQTSNGQEGDTMNNSNTTPASSNNITISVNSKTFSATLQDNETAQAFKSSLPMTIDMSDVNSNEKAYDLADNLPTNASNPGRIQNGDLMLYGSRTLVVFYKSFSTSYTYTKIGSINDPSGLQQALGSGDATVTFQIN